MRWLSKTRYKIGFLVPTLLVYVVFIILPIFIAIGYSFTRYSGIGKARFIGLDNYKRLFHDQLFWKSLQNTAIIFVLASVLLLVLSFLLALLLNNKLKFADTSKALVFSPAIIAPIIVGIIWVYILDPKIGVIITYCVQSAPDRWRSNGSAAPSFLHTAWRSSISGSSSDTLPPSSSPDSR